MKKVLKKNFYNKDKEMTVEINSRGNLEIEINNADSKIKLENILETTDIFKMTDQSDNVLYINYKMGEYFCTPKYENLSCDQTELITNKEMIEVLNNFRISLEHEEKFKPEEDFFDEEEFYEEDEFF